MSKNYLMVIKEITVSDVFTAKIFVGNFVGIELRMR